MVYRGDRISCKDDKVYVNDKALDEPYLDNEWANAIRDTVDAFTEDFTEVCLQEDEYWLMGDNRINSRDSRDFDLLNAARSKERMRWSFSLFIRYIYQSR